MRLKEESRESFHSCEGCTTLFETMNCGNKKICSFVGLQMELDAIFAEGKEEGESFLGKRSARLEELLTRCCFADEEVAKYAKVSPQLWLPYTRNLVQLTIACGSLTPLESGQWGCCTCNTYLLHGHMGRA